MNTLSHTALSHTESAVLKLHTCMVSVCSKDPRIQIIIGHFWKILLGASDFESH